MMTAPNQKELENLLRNYLRHYGHMTKEIESGWEIYKDDFGQPLFNAPYLKITLKEDADIMEDLQSFEGIRVQNPK